MAGLLVGPLLRFVSETEATVWVETDGPCQVEIHGHAERTFHVEGHHYALVVIRGLEPGRRYEYSVRLDGELRWPVPDSGFPVSVIQTLDPGRTARIVFGSCRVSVPHVSPFSLDRLIDSHGRGLDALAAFARRLIDQPREVWPHVLLLLGDQVYADDVPEATIDFIRSRRDPEQPPGESVGDFEEYAHLYCASWTEPLMRWLLSTVSTSMIFDDHDVIDDWNISEAWLRDMRATDWWEERIVAAFMSYWIYQHLGNLSPAELEDDPFYAAVREADDAGPILRTFSFYADRESAGSRWAYRRDLGGTRLIVLDSRAARVLRDGRREMLDETEWRWLEENVEGSMAHLVIASSVPMLMAQGMHYAETWSERVGDGAWGRLPARAMERVRRALDMEHWAAFGASLERLMTLLAEVGSGRRGGPPASIVMVSGDVHHGYLARVAYRRSTGVKSAVYQSVTSPFRNPLGRGERMFQRVSASRGMAAITRLLAISAGASPPIVRWRRLEGLAFENQVSTLEMRGGNAMLRLEKAVAPDGSEDAQLETVWERRLAPAPRDPRAMATDTDGEPADHVDPAPP
ncbi:MAG: alkaline phosphatase family protein [Chloroflexota bacterium]|nr:alkaline phosphatase family protein [Chloroflexota bacterium]